MPARLLTFGTLLAFIALPGPARTADAAKAPTVVVRVKSIDGLIEDVKFLGRHVGMEEESKQIDGFARVFFGGKDMPTIDTTRPIGFYGSISENVADSTGVLLIPVADEQGFLGLLERFSFGAKKGADGIYEGKSDNFPMPVPVYFKFANQYAYFAARTKEPLQATLPDPATVLAQSPAATASAVFRLDQVPAGLRNLALSVLDMRLAEAQKSQQPADLKSLNTLRTELLKNGTQQVAGEAGELAVVLDVDHKAGELVAEVGLSGKPGSKLASQIAELGQAKSRFGALAAGKAALDFVLHVTADDKLRKALEPVVDEAVQKALANSKNEGERAFATRLLKILDPTFKAGELDAGAVVTGPSADGLYTAVGGIKVKDAKELDKFIRDLLQVMPEQDRKKVQLDVATVGDTKVHRLNSQGDFDADARAFLGNHPLYFAVRPDVALLSAGPDALKAIEAALKAQPAAAPLIRLDVALNRFAPSLAKSAKSRGDKGGQEFFEKMAKDAASGSEKDVVRVTLEGGKSLKLRISLSAHTLKYAPRSAVPVPGRG